MQSFSIALSNPEAFIEGTYSWPGRVPVILGPFLTLRSMAHLFRTKRWGDGTMPKAPGTPQLEHSDTFITKI